MVFRGLFFKDVFRQVVGDCVSPGGLGRIICLGLRAMLGKSRGRSVYLYLWGL